jgi:hypothetical protein
VACGTVALAAIGLTAGEENAALASTAFFLQLIIVLALIGRALEMGGDTGKSFFGPAFDLVWYAIRDFFLEVFLRKGMIFFRRFFPEKKQEAARNRWGCLQVERRWPTA